MKIDKDRYSANKSIVSDLNKIKNKLYNEIEKVLEKYGFTENQSTTENHIYALETENKKLKREISDLKKELGMISEKNLGGDKTKQLPQKQGRHSWTREEEYFCAEEYIKCYVIQKANIDLNSFVKKIKKYCPDISDGSLKAKMQNIKWVCSNNGVTDTFPTNGLKNASKECVAAVDEALRKYKLK